MIFISLYEYSLVLLVLYSDAMPNVNILCIKKLELAILHSYMKPRIYKYIEWKTLLDFDPQLYFTSFAPLGKLAIAVATFPLKQPMK